jgi:hypothetical protein
MKTLWESKRDAYIAQLKRSTPGTQAYKVALAVLADMGVTLEEAEELNRKREFWDAYAAASMRSATAALSGKEAV